MRIKELIKQHRRDFTAVFECDHCGYEDRRTGYDDRHFHQVVIPALLCPSCGKTAKDNYRPLSPKYPEGFQV